MIWVRHMAFATLISVIILIFVGAIVRVTGSGLGCPDWPRCWGCLIPPRHVDDIDFDKIDLRKFKAKAQRYGRDPAEITRDSLRNEFQAKHTWIEFTNRLCSLPVGFFSIALLVACIQSRKRWLIFKGALAVFLVGLNAWLGARVVYSGLSPGIITLHWGLAFFLLGVLVTFLRPHNQWEVSRSNRILSWSLLILTVAEALMGAQVREKTDTLQKLYPDVDRIQWTHELEHSWMYLAHRSFSWVIFLGVLWLCARVKKERCFIQQAYPRSLKVLFSLVWVMMLLGVLLAHWGIHSFVQVAHVGLSAILMATLQYWCLSCKNASLHS